MKTILIVLTLAFSASSLHAAPDNPRERTAAQRLLNLINPREMMITAIGASAEQMIAQVPEKKKEAVRRAFTRYAESVADSKTLRDQMIAAYEAAFSESELNELLAFYATPVGKKSLTKLPELAQKGMIIGQQAALENQTAFQAEIAAIMKGS